MNTSKMTQVQWMTCADPRVLIQASRDQVSDRKLRLFAIACCRRIMHLLTDVDCQQAVAVAELYADKKVRDAELTTACDVVLAKLSQPESPSNRWATIAAARVCMPCYENRVWAERAIRTAEAACYAIGESSGIALVNDPSVQENKSTRRQRKNDPSCAIPIEIREERSAQASLFRDIVQCPSLQPVVPSSSAMQCAQLVKLARTSYDSGQFDQVYSVGECLKKMSTQDELLVTHCLSNITHVKGCWAIDLILSKDR